MKNLSANKNEEKNDFSASLRPFGTHNSRYLQGLRHILLRYRYGERQISANVIGHFKQQTDNIEKQMRPLIFDMLFNDDRKFVMEISRVTVNGEPKWAVITRRNVPDYTAFRSDSFETREEALEYYKNVVVETPLVSLNGQSPNPRKTIEEYKQWLIDKGLTDNYI